MATLELDMDRLPRHIAIIMDGNGRWATRHGQARVQGHEEGAKSARAIISACRELEHIEALTLYAFSTENWRRSKEEVNALFELLSQSIARELDQNHDKNIRIVFMGRMKGLYPKTVADIEHCMEKTRDNTAMTVNVAINYGARAEIADACQAIAKKAVNGEIDPAEIDEETVARHLYVPDLPDPDLLIRTSGELRLSNFMLWQLSYSEIVVVKTLWPDFRRRHLYKAIAAYQARGRRYGGR